MVRPAHHGREPGVRRDPRELAVRVAGRLEDHGARRRVLLQPRRWRRRRRSCGARARAGRRARTRPRAGADARSPRWRGRAARRRRPRRRAARRAVARAPVCRQARSAKTTDRDAEERPRLVVELEDRVHPLELIAVVVLEVAELAAGDHRERQDEEPRGVEDRRGVLAAGPQRRGRRAGSRAPRGRGSAAAPVFRVIIAASSAPPRGRRQPEVAAPPRSARLSSARRPERQDADGEEEPPDAEKLDEARLLLGPAEALVGQLIGERVGEPEERARRRSTRTRRRRPARGGRSGGHERPPVARNAAAAASPRPRAGVFHLLAAIAVPATSAVSA